MCCRTCDLCPGGSKATQGRDGPIRPDQSTGSRLCLSLHDPHSPRAQRRSQGLQRDAHERLAERSIEYPPRNNCSKSGHDPCPPRHAGEGRYPRLCRMHQGKSWIPAFAGMTGWRWCAGTRFGYSAADTDIGWRIVSDRLGMAGTGQDVAVSLVNQEPAWVCPTQPKPAALRFGHLHGEAPGPGLARGKREQHNIAALSGQRHHHARRPGFTSVLNTSVVLMRPEKVVENDEAGLRPVNRHDRCLPRSRPPVRAGRRANRPGLYRA